MDTKKILYNIFNFTWSHIRDLYDNPCEDEQTLKKIVEETNEYYKKLDIPENEKKLANMLLSTLVAYAGMQEEKVTA